MAISTSKYLAGRSDECRLRSPIDADIMVTEVTVDQHARDVSQFGHGAHRTVTWMDITLRIAVPGDQENRDRLYAILQHGLAGGALKVAGLLDHQHDAFKLLRPTTVAPPCEPGPPQSQEERGADFGSW